MGNTGCLRFGHVPLASGVRGDANGPESPARGTPEDVPTGTGSTESRPPEEKRKRPFDPIRQIRLIRGLKVECAERLLGPGRFEPLKATDIVISPPPELPRGSHA